MTEMPLFRRYPGDDRDVLIFGGAGGRRIGVSVTELTKQLSDHFGVSGGLLVINVREDSPAAKAGLKAGDLIVDVDGKEMKVEFDLIRAIGEKKEGSVNLTIVRDKNRQTITVTPEEVKSGFNNLFEGFEGEGLAHRQFKGVRPPAPSSPPSPVQLNHLFVPGRVI